MSTADLEVPFDDVPGDTKMASQSSYGPSVYVEIGQQEMIFCTQFGLRAAPHIDRSCYWFNVLGVHAESDSAEMICLKSIRPRTDSFFPYGSMCNDVASSDLDLPVAAFPDCRSFPYPARSNEAHVLNTEVASIYQANPHSHKDASYHLTVRVDLEGYEEVIST